jgi:hypothetical protein
MNMLLAILKAIFGNPWTNSFLGDEPSPPPPRLRLEGGPPLKLEAPPRRAAERETVVTRNFKLIFIGVLGLTVAALIAQGAIVLTQGDGISSGVKELVAYLRTLSTAGFGAIVGMLGGKLA